jgi:hypothetical protein
MSKKSKPDLSKLKSRIQNPDEVEEREPPKPDLDGPSIKPETIRQMKDYARDVEKLRKEEHEEEQEPEKIELEEVPEGTSPAAFDDHTYYRQTPSDNPKVRKAIEDKCSEMDFADLIITGRVTQVVPVIPNKLEVEYQSLLASETFWIEREAENQGTSDWALRSWMGYARLAMAIVSINGKDFPGKNLTTKDEIDRDSFERKFKSVMNMGEKPIEYLLVNLGWFNDRVDRLSESDFDELKNG